MNKRVLTTSLLLSLMLSSTPVLAAVTSCDAIMDKINTKLEHKNVNDYSLKVISKDTETSLRVVGVCEGGSKKIIYKKHKAKKSEKADKTEE
ncbi:DUF1161 domain-containing protein [Undibacterium sp. Dicai25W]|uniref:DUF1161 domain-containing protein n=1 Tax=Undibacterium sp. Dicai25W TaxID=3413034 RepID=UPI003BF3A364